MKFRVFLSVALFAIISIASVSAQSNDKKKRSKKKKGEVTNVQPAPKKVDPEKAAYDKAVKGAVVKKGLFTTHLTKDGKLFFEVSEADIKGRDFLISNRIAETSNPKDFVAGQMITDPFMVRFEIKNDKLYMYAAQTDYECKEGDDMETSFKRNYQDPVIRVFPKVALNEGRLLIDATPFFGAPNPFVNPIAKPSNPKQKPLGGKFEQAGAYISSVKTFAENVEIKSFMPFTQEDKAYTVTTHRSLMRLPEEPMKMRLQDRTYGYFSSSRQVFRTDKDGMDKYSFVHRWRLEPKEEDMERYMAGELVEPKKQIVFYVDNAFPEKWKGSIIQGINDWNIAFEKAGFKNAIVGKPYPTDNPDFDPDDMRYSCFKYAATDIPNAMGPSYTDPRSGEILTADVIWYHNVISLVHNWRFSQTAAVDPRVRKKVFSDELMQECLRYVAAHEIGHTLGLMHNMGASNKVPVDSLRSATFTQKYGTTPSIMDYTRNNYVAQPGDLEKGVKMTPPVMGVFDMLNIKWGYQYIPNTTSETEKELLAKEVKKYSTTIPYRFGPQQFPFTIDPRDQGEDLGDNPYRANELGFKNLRLIIKNLEKWSAAESNDYSFMANNYKEIVSQYSRMVGHIMPFIGGCYVNQEVAKQDNGLVARKYLSKKETDRAMRWLMNEARTYNDWLTPSYVTTKLGMPQTSNDKIATSIIGSLVNAAALNRIYESEIMGNKDAYKLRDYIANVTNEILAPAKKGSLKRVDKVIQSNYVDYAIAASGVKPKAGASAGGGKKLSEVESAYENFVLTSKSYDSLTHSIDLANSGEDSFYRVTYTEPTLPANVLEPIMLGQLKNILNVYKNAVKGSNAANREFYNHQIMKIERALNNN